MEELMLRVDGISKEYTLGQIGGTTLRDELQRLNAKRKHKDDPSKKIGARDYEYGEKFLALNNVSFDVKKGERVGIIGHNGAGKSTLLKLISRVTAPTEGFIGLNGRVASMLEVGTGFHGELTGRENIYMNGAILGMKKREIDSKIEDIIEFSECRQFIDTPVKRYSSGMYVKLAFAVAAHLDSEIMIMDEVLAVGDMAFQKKCLEKMSDVSKAEGRTILYVSHNMNTIRQLCERSIVLEHGRIIFDGDVETGISTYLGLKKMSPVFINLEELPRETAFSNRIVTMTFLKNIGSNESIFEVGSQIDLGLACKATKKIEEAQFRCIIRDNNSVPITMLTTNKTFVIEKGENYFEFSLDISHLAPGRYSLSPVIYEVNNMGSNVNLDVLREIFCFEIIQTSGFNNNMIWLSKYWGNVYGDPISIKNMIDNQFR